MPDRIKQIFVDTFKEFSNTTFIWKYEAPEDGSIEKLPNLHLQKWVDQPGLLTHPNLLGFITHGGLNSIMEATYCGAPVITIGLFGDQERNGKMAEYRGYGLTLDKLKLSKASLGEKLSEIIGNDK
jgi:UDP:flavonoid glycosyltransferase YjiC (YdhE family)